MRAVLDVNVLVAALLSRNGSPARLLLAWLDGAFELVISPALIDELRRALAYPKIRRRIAPTDAERFVSLLLEGAVDVADPPGEPPLRSADRDDDYLIALAASSGALLITGDGHLLDLAERAPIHTPAEFVDLIRSR